MQLAGTSDKSSAMQTCPLAVDEVNKCNRFTQEHLYAEPCTTAAMATLQRNRSYQAVQYDRHRSDLSVDDNRMSSPHEESALTQALAQLNSNTMGIDDMLLSSTQMKDDLDEVMHKLELSTASLIVAETTQNTSGDVNRGRPNVVPRRVSMLSTAPRSKPPPPIRRTSSVSGTHRTSLGQSQKSHIHNEGTTGSGNTVVHTSVALVTSPYATPDCPQHAAPVRRTLSSAYAGVMQTLNNQLTVSDSVSPSVGRRSFRRASSMTTTDNGISNGNGSGRTFTASGTAPQIGGRHSNTSTDCMMSQIERGVVLRQTSVSDDRSTARY